MKIFPFIRIFFTVIIFFILSGSRFLSNLLENPKNKNHLTYHLNRTNPASQNNITLCVMGEWGMLFEEVSNYYGTFNSNQSYLNYKDIFLLVPLHNYTFKTSFQRPIDYSSISENSIYDNEYPNDIIGYTYKQSSGGINILSINAIKTNIPNLYPEIGLSYIINHYKCHTTSYYYGESYMDDTKLTETIKNDFAVNAKLLKKYFNFSVFFSFLYPLQGEKAFPLILESGFYYSNETAGAIFRYEDWGWLDDYKQNEVDYLLFLSNKIVNNSLKYGLLGSINLNDNISIDNGFFAGILIPINMFEFSIYSQLLFSDCYIDRFKSQKVNMSSFSLTVSVSYLTGH